MKKPQHDFEPLAILSVEGVASQAFVESVRMKLYDQLETPQTVDQIASAFDMTVHTAEVFLDLLEARGLLVASDGTYANSPVASEYLVSHSPFYQGNCIELHHKLNEKVMREMTGLLHGAGKPSDISKAMQPDADYLQSLVQYSMRGGLQDVVEFISGLSGFAEMHAMCDVGGNHGRYSMALLDRNPNLKSMIVDLPDVVGVASNWCGAAGYEERLSFAPCNLQCDSLPRQPYDLILASHVLYLLSDCLDEGLARLAQALTPGGWLVLHHLDPNNKASQRFRTAMDLTACLTRHSRHVLHPEQCESALSRAGLSNIQKATSGYHGENVILAAQQAREG